MGRARGIAAGLVVLLPLACATPERSPFVSLAAVAPGIERDIRYAGSDNFVGAPIDGYEVVACWLTEPAARALAAVQADLAAEGLGLRVFDCYRPQRAVDHFVRWAADPADTATKARYYPRLAKADLFPLGYIADRSSHSRGSTVDVTLIQPRADGVPVELDMGTPYDFFDPRSHTDSGAVSAKARTHRHRLRAAMERRGFANYPTEWWHFTLESEPHPEQRFDLPIR